MAFEIGKAGILPERHYTLLVAKKARVDGSCCCSLFRLSIPESPPFLSFERSVIGEFDAMVTCNDKKMKEGK